MAINSDALISYIASHREEFLSGLKEFLRIPSVSTLPQYSGEIGQAAEFVANELRGIGMRNVQKIQTVSVSNIPIVMIGFGLPDDNTHAPNEKLSLSNFYRGIETIARYLDKLGT